MEPTRTERSGWMTGLIAGGLAGLLLVGGLGGVGVFAMAKYRERQEIRSKGSWSLVPAVVFDHDLKAGDTLGIDDVAQRAFPEQFVTASVVKPDEATLVIGARLAQPVRSGDLATWQSLADGKSPEACERVCRWAAGTDPARAQEIREAVKKLEAPETRRSR